MNALIADDSPYLRKELREMVGRTGIDTVFEAADGNEALDLIDAERPRIILLDLVMDGMDGMTFLKHLQERDGDHTVIVVTAMNEEAVKDRTEELGAARFIEKPVRMDDVRDAVEHIQNQ